MAWNRLGIGQTDPDTTCTNPVNPANPANPERGSDQPEPDNAGLTEFSGCTGFHEKGAGFDEAPPAPEDPTAGYDPEGSFDALRDKLLDKFTGSTKQTTNGNGERRAPVLKTDNNRVPPGGLTNSTPGLTDEVLQALAKARAAVASSVTDGQATGYREDGDSL
jgi:hypothetical protein